MPEAIAQRPHYTAPLVILLAVLAAAVAAYAPLVAIAMIGAVAGSLVVGLSRSMVLAIVVISGSADFLGRFDAGPISTMGMLTILYAGGIWAIWIMRARGTPHQTLVIVPFLLFAGWGLLSLVLWYEASVSSVQNVLVIAAFLGLVFLSARDIRAGATTEAALGKAFDIATGLAAALYLAGMVLPGSLARYSIGTRTFALFIMVSLAWYVAGWRTGSRRSLLMAVGIVGLLGLSLSRTAFVTALALFPLAQMRLSSVGGWFRLIFSGVIAVGLLYAAVWYIEPLHERFFEGDTSLELFGLRINTEGRMAAWEVVIDSYNEKPWLGKGVGSSQALIDVHFPWLNHPHNDYLRILHDYGLVGMVLWAVGYIWLLVVTWRAWQRADRSRDPAGRVHLAAFLALVGVALAMITDNVIVYIFVMAPLGVLVGTSLGLMNRGQQCESST